MSLAVIISETKVLLNDIELQLSRSSCSRRPRLEHVINQPVAGFGGCRGTRLNKGVRQICQTQQGFKPIKNQIVT